MNNDILVAPGVSVDSIVDEIVHVKTPNREGEEADCTETSTCSLLGALSLVNTKKGIFYQVVMSWTKS